jgi:copper resistance protein B
MTRLRMATAFAGALLLPVAALHAQAMDHAMPGMAMPMPGKPALASPAKARKPAARPVTPAKASPKAPVPPASRQGVQSDPHAGHTMPAMIAPTPAAAAMAGAPEPAGTDLPPGNAPAPLPLSDHIADAVWGAAEMAVSREDLRREHGGMTFRQILFNIAEYQPHAGKDGYRWDGEAWIGGDIDRLTIKTEGSGRIGGRVEHAEAQALYSRAVDPYWNLQAGIRQDFGSGPARSYATLAVEGLAPYWFDVEAASFLSDRGDVTGRVEAYYDQRLTQFVMIQPRIEANLSAQKVAVDGLGAGLTDLDLGLRLRYDRSREFAPYIGVAWERRLGDTAHLVRARGDDVGGASIVAGVRAWF